MPTRTILKERESKPLLEALAKLVGMHPFPHKPRVELEGVKDGEVVFVEGEPLAAKKSGMFLPVLVNGSAVDSLPKVVVDMGAVPHVASGADIMAPGIREVRGNFSVGQLLVIVDEKHGKHLAIGRALIDSATLAGIKKGKAVENLHYVGDPIWEAVKSFMHVPAAASS